MADKCEACGNRGYIEAVADNSSGYGDNILHIERCDGCFRFETDNEASLHIISLAMVTLNANQKRGK